METLNRLKEESKDLLMIKGGRYCMKVDGEKRRQGDREKNANKDRQKNYEKKDEGLKEGRRTT